MHSIRGGLAAKRAIAAKTQRELFQHLGHRAALNQAASGGASRPTIASILRMNAPIFSAGHS